jgi:hypothetical protein
VPAIPSWLLEPLWDQFAALLPDRPVYHPLADTIITVRRLIREAWTLYRWEARPARRP